MVCKINFKWPFRVYLNSCCQRIHHDTGKNHQLCRCHDHCICSEDGRHLGGNEVELNFDKKVKNFLKLTRTILQVKSTITFAKSICSTDSSTIAFLGSIALNYTKKIKVIYQSLVLFCSRIEQIFLLAEGHYNDQRDYVHLGKFLYKLELSAVPYFTKNKQVYTLRPFETLLFS